VVTKHWVLLLLLVVVDGGGGGGNDKFAFTVPSQTLVSYIGVT
jgi:hypothetical protein